MPKKIICVRPAISLIIGVLKLWAGLTFEEIATALVIPPNTAASRYRYALEKLRAIMLPSPFGRGVGGEGL